jgi:hypothetical protein
VAQSQFVAANQSTLHTPLTASPPAVDEYVDERSENTDDDDGQPEAVNDESGAPAAPIKKRVIRRR